MSRQRTQVVLYLDANEADTLIQLLAELRDTLWVSYGDEIIAMRREKNPETETDLDDDINF